MAHEPLIKARNLEMYNRLSKAFKELPKYLQRTCESIEIDNKGILFKHSPEDINGGYVINVPKTTISFTQEVSTIYVVGENSTIHEFYISHHDYTVKFND